MKIKHINKNVANTILALLLTIGCLSIVLLVVHWSYHKINTLSKQVYNLELANEQIAYAYNNNNEVIEKLKVEYNTKLDEIRYATVEEELQIIELIKEDDKLNWFKLYKEIFTIHNVDAPETIYDYYNDEEINIMHRCIETETFGADFESKANVASVILNRIESTDYPNNPINVITAPNQFAYGRTNISDETILALEYAFMIEDTTNGCIAFRSDSKKENWGKWKYQFTDNVGHSFYK